MANWRQIIATSQDVKLSVNSPNAFKVVSQESVSTELAALVENIVSVSGSETLTTSLKYLNMSGRRFKYEDSQNNVSQGNVGTLDSAKVDALVAAIEAVVV